MNDKVVFITGAKGGLGSFITRRFLETGANVVGASRSISQQDFPGPNFTALAVDFTKAAAVNDAVRQTRCACPRVRWFRRWAKRRRNRRRHLGTNARSKPDIRVLRVARGGPTFAKVRKRTNCGRWESDRSRTASPTRGVHYVQGCARDVGPHGGA